MNLTILSIYQNNIDLKNWIENLPKQIDHVLLILPIQDKHYIDHTNQYSVQITYLCVDTNELFQSLHNKLTELKVSWFAFMPMHYQFTTELAEEINNIIANSNESTTLYIKKREYIQFLGENIRKGGFQKQPALLLFNSLSLADHKLYFASIKDLKAPITTIVDQSFDNFHFELDIYQQVLSYSDFLNNKKVYKIYFFTNPFGTFMYRGLIRGGFFEGKAGFTLTYLYALASFKRVLFLWMRYKKID
ncbi:hypothetical protein [Myroides profundi]|uniref:Uncharacterized protein n=1 Tax=Myroides profundi TaxID=480520 RepID=A0AAJ5BDQ8_MYRPR|nr:hypothetical protein [Myroides profundi]AJH15891.1 hypothetical protein MPR_2726 [Myroides profundi]SEQ71848.1 hypothetical protein SAMN04488089_105143 [Myroides profundi]